MAINGHLTALYGIMDRILIQDNGYVGQPCVQSYRTYLGLTLITYNILDGSSSKAQPLSDGHESADGLRLEACTSQRYSVMDRST